MKKFLLLLCFITLTGCGANVNRSAGIENEQAIILIAPKLVGNQVSIGKIVDHSITSADLMPYPFGLIGVSDTEDEKSQRLRIKVEQGNQQLTLKDRKGKVIYSKKIYVSAGQTREIKI